MMNNVSRLVFTALLFSTATFVQAAVNFSKNESYSQSQVSADIQGFGNEVIDQVGKSKYIKFDQQGTEYAFSIVRMGSNDVKYTGNPNDIKGIVFLLVRAYKDGFELPSQVSTFTPSNYNNAIKIVKMDRNDERPYEFDLGMDADKKLYIINSPTSVGQLQQVDEIKKDVPLTERQKKFIW
ncbi:hypothetical protein QF043_005961 [Pseudomonas sp. W3I7]|uniref:hypothetical protein n=1 Tax=Pseudomonas sp. W3I7 TaxID=3042292 RepID=UPI00278D7E82|nr:hypothetical protein [Pseudomonas sp. W3I7]MDQ0707169.1 hypothetical protein [Pseudomonas sp. W3I7]